MFIIILFDVKRRDKTSTKLKLNPINLNCTLGLKRTKTKRFENDEQLNSNQSKLPACLNKIKLKPCVKYLIPQPKIWAQCNSIHNTWVIFSVYSRCPPLQIQKTNDTSWKSCCFWQIKPCYSFGSKTATIRKLLLPQLVSGTVYPNTSPPQSPPPRLSSSKGKGAIPQWGLGEMLISQT